MATYSQQTQPTQSQQTQPIVQTITQLVSPKTDEAMASLILTAAQEQEIVNNHASELMKRELRAHDKRENERDDEKRALNSMRKRAREFEVSQHQLTTDNRFASLTATIEETKRERQFEGEFNKIASELSHEEAITKLREKQDNAERARQRFLQENIDAHSRKLHCGLRQTQKDKDIAKLESEFLAELAELEQEETNLAGVRELARIKRDAEEELEDEQLAQRMEALERNLETRRNEINSRYNISLHEQQIARSENRISLFEKWGYVASGRFYELEENLEEYVDSSDESDMWDEL